MVIFMIKIKLIFKIDVVALYLLIEVKGAGNLRKKVAQIVKCGSSIDEIIVQIQIIIYEKFYEGESLVAGKMMSLYVKRPKTIAGKNDQ